VKFSIILLLFFLSNASAKNVYTSVLDEAEVTTISNKFLSEKEEVASEKFELKNIGFIGSDRQHYSSHWYLIYQRKAEIVHGKKVRRTNWFTVYVTNNQTPELKLVWGY